MQKHEENLAARINGNALQPLQGASVTVTDDATGLPASLYSDDGVTPLAQPIISGNEGEYAFYTANGEYTLTFSGTRFATFTRKLIMDDPSDNPSVSAAALAAPSGAAQVGSGLRTVADQLNDISNVENFTGASAAVKIQAALDAMAAAGSGTVHATQSYSVDATITVPSNVSFVMAKGCTLKPTTNAIVVRQKPSSNFTGKIDCSSLVGWDSVALDFDGDDNATATPFRLHVPTTFDADLIGAKSGSNGTAVKLHADNNPNARVMGVIGKARVSGFDNALWLRQTSTDHARFVTGNIIEIESSESLRGLYMESAEPNGYDIDGNRIRVQLQPRNGTTVPGMVICGQMNVLDLLPWDWDTVQATAPIAISIAAGARKNFIITAISTSHLSNASAQATNYIMNLWDSGGLSVGQLRTAAADGVLDVLAASMRFDNGKGIISVAADGLNEYPVLLTDASNRTFVQSMNVAGAKVVLNARSATGQIEFKINDATLGGVTSAGDIWGASATISGAVAGGSLRTNGQVLIGSPTSFAMQSAAPRLQNQSDSFNNSYWSNVSFTNDANPAGLIFGKSRSGVVGTHTVVQSGDDLGAIRFEGSDGTAMKIGASIVAEVDGTPGAGDMPGRIVLSTTPDGSSTATERMRIDNAGNIGINGVSFGSGSKVMFIANATTVPTVNPTGGGILYVEAGALKYRGSSGTITTIGVA